MAQAQVVYILLLPIPSVGDPILNAPRITHQTTSSDWMAKMFGAKIWLVGLTVMLFSNAAVASASDFTLESYFTGRTKAVGRFSAINGVRRDFTVDLKGTWDGKTLVLVENFLFSDGLRDRKTWRFTKTAQGQYLGTREDVSGDTVVTIEGNVAKFSYLVALDPQNPTNLVRFHDTMILQSDGSVVNKALVTKYGFPVGVTRVTFQRR